MDVTYRINFIPHTSQIIAVYDSAGINRPTHDPLRIEKMYQNSNLVVTAWDQHLLVGIARSLTDFCYRCYLSDLAVRQEYKNKGISKKLIALTQEQIGKQTTLLLLSAPGAINYYPKIGFDNIPNGFIMHRSE